MPHRRPHVLLPRLRPGVVVTVTHGERPADRDEFHRLAGEHTVVPGLERAARRPRDAGRGVRQARRRRAGLPARVGRARRAVEPVLVRRPQPVGDDGPARRAAARSTATCPPSVPTDQGMLAAIEALLAVYTSPVIDDLPPLHGGVMGYLGYDVIREVERLPDVPPDDHGLPDAVMSVIGSLAAFDHWRPARVPDRERAARTSSTGADLDDAYDAAVVRVHAAIDRLAQPLPYVPRRPARWRVRRCRSCARRCPTGCTSGRSRSPRSTSSRATSSRSCWPSATTSSSTPIRSTSTACCGR